METKRPRAPSPQAMTAPTPPSPPSSSSDSVTPPLAFSGSSEQDVSLAKSFWNSVTLQPPLESRLGPRRVSVCNGNGSGSRRVSTSAAAEIEETERREWKEKYLEKAKRREEIIALLKKQREERISKELLSQLHKPKSKAKQRGQESSERKESVTDSDLEDEKSVKALP